MSELAKRAEPGWHVATDSIKYHCNALTLQHPLGYTGHCSRPRTKAKPGSCVGLQKAFLLDIVFYIGITPVLVKYILRYRAGSLHVLHNCLSTGRCPLAPPCLIIDVFHTYLSSSQTGTQRAPGLWCTDCEHETSPSKPGTHNIGLQ
jgi:hypothetical protein